MILSNPLRARLGIRFGAFRRGLPAAILATALLSGPGAGPAFAFRPETANPGLQGKSDPYRSGFKQLRHLRTEDLLDPGEAPRRDRVALKGDASAEILRRLNARLKAAGGEARIRSVAADALGNRHIRVDLYHRGYPVIGGDAVIHVNADDEIYAVGGSLAEGLSPAAAPGLKPDSARALARAGLSSPSAAVEKQAPRLVVFDGVLAYETLVEEPGLPPRLWKSYHDAATGALLFRSNRIVDAAPVGGAPQNVTGSLLTGEGGAVATVGGWRDNAGFYFLRNDNEKWGVYDEVRQDWSQNTTGIWGTTDRAAVSLARNEELTQRYVSQVLGRNSFDNAGALAVANVHYGSSYVNAFWDGSQFNFGDGDNVTAGPLTVLDVAAHEYGHAITQYTSNLDYVNESGALNESYSDILGTLVEFWAQPDGRSAYPAAVHGSADWLMGEDCWLASDALRDLRNPQRYGQPSYYGGTNWSVGSGDNGGVHTNSGVQNFAFYLLSEGGNGSNDGHAYAITGLGEQQAGAIAMYANMYLLTSTAQYSDTRAAWILAATTLGYNAQTVRDVWTACGVLEQVSHLSASPANLAFGTVATGAALMLNLALANDGGAPTTVTALSFDNAAYSAGFTTPFTVPAGSTVQLPVTFRPPALGDDPGQLILSSNASDHPSITVSLQGSGAAPSMLRLTPDHIQADVDAGGTAVRTLTVGNAGSADLRFSIAGTDGGVFINEFSNEPDFIELWNQGPDRDLGGWRLSWVDDAGSSVLSFVFPSGFTLRSGRRVVVRENTGAANDSTFYAGANIGWVQGSAVAVTLADAGGNGIDFVRTLNSTTLPPAGTAWSGGGVDFSGYSAYRNQNADTDGPSGWATSMTPSEFLLNPGQSPMASLPPWMSIAPVSGTVAAGQSQDVAVTLNAAGLPAAGYSASFFVKTNDPSIPASGVAVPVDFTVRGARHLAVTPASLAFGNVWAGSSRSLPVTLRNDGNQATTLASLASDNPRFTAPAGSVTVPPFGTVTVQVAFSPADLGAQAGTLTLSGDAQDNPVLTVALSGAGTAPPSAALSPSSFTLSLTPDQAPADRTATLSNAGGDNLAWQIASIAQTGSPLGQAQPVSVPVVPAVQSRLIYDEANYAHAYVPGRVIVAFKPGLSSFAGAHTAADVGIEEMRELARAIDPKTHRKAYTGRSLMLLELKDPDGVRQAVGILKQDANVAYAEPDYLVKATAIPNDPSFNLLYGMQNTGQNGGIAGADIHATEAWDRHTGNRSILIGVIDTGIDYAHPDLAANIWTNPGEIPGNGIDDDGNGFVDDVHGWDFAYDDSNPMDGHYHGTHVSGTIAGVGNNGAGVAGVMWTASLVAIKFLDDSGSGTTSDAIDAVNYAHAMGVRVTNNSWGGGAFSQALMDAIAAGGLFVAAAGNSSSDNDTSPQYPASYALDNIISVAATDNRDALASFSSYGHTTVDLGAPGVNIYSAQPGGLYQYLSGTSMATPHVTGAAGLVWSYNPTLTAAQVKTALLSSVDPDPALAGRTVTGGRLNARKALEAAGPSWLRAAPLQPGTLAPGASAPITVTVDPAGLVAGRWTGVVNISTDDPLQPNLPIAVAADVSGCRSLAVEPAALDFATRFTGTTARANLTLRNTCNDTVTVSAASSGDPAFAFASALPLLVLPFGTASVPVEFRPLAARTYATALSLTSNADADPIKTVDLTGLGVDPPVATVTPSSVSQTLAAGTSAVVDLDIGNTGGSDLNWTLSGVDRGFVPVAPYDATHFVPMDKGQADTRIGRPVTEASGGPDAFGYRWIDSDQPGGPLYQWQDIQSTGTQVISGCDDCYASRTLGFAFPFYGNSFTQVNISSNGYVTFGTPSSQFSNYPIPSTSMPANLVAAFFDDLLNGPIYFQDFGDRAIIQFQNVGYFSGSGTVTFQIVLHADGEIDYYYDNMTGSVLSATTGIQNATGTVGLQVQYNTAYIKNHLAVRISTLPAWLRVSAVSGTVPAGGDQHLALTVDATSLRGGTYTQTMTLASNNPAQAAISIPVTLTVTGQAQTGISRVLRVGPSALPAAGGSRYYMWNLTVGGEARGLARGSRYTLYLK